MSLKTIVRFCAIHPLYVIGFWILLMVAAGFLSQLYLDDALKGGQGPTRDLEFALAAKMKDQKLSLPNAHMDGGEAGESKKSDYHQHEDEEAAETLLVVTSNTYQFPSEQFLAALNGFLRGIQVEIDANGIDRKVGKLEDYAVHPSRDGTTVMIPAPVSYTHLTLPTKA